MDTQIQTEEKLRKQEIVRSVLLLGYLLIILMTQRHSKHDLLYNPVFILGYCLALFLVTLLLISILTRPKFILDNNSKRQVSYLALLSVRELQILGLSMPSSRNANNQIAGRLIVTSDGLSYTIAKHPPTVLNKDNITAIAFVKTSIFYKYLRISFTSGATLDFRVFHAGPLTHVINQYHS